MSATIGKNEVTPALKRSDLIIYADSGAPADPGVDFIALGLVFVKTSLTKYALAVGTMTNNRRPLVVADFTITATDTTAETTTKAAHTLQTGDGPFRPTTTAGGFTSGTDYYPIYVDDNTVKWATSLANAYAGTALNITASVNGMVFQDVPGTTERGIPGHFTYEWAQAETNVDTSELSVLVDGTGYNRRNGGGAYTTVTPGGTMQDFDSIGEDTYTYGDLLRLVVSICLGTVTDFTTATQIFKALDGVKVRATGTTTATGRTAVTIGDVTP